MKTESKTEAIDVTLRIVRNVKKWQQDRDKREAMMRWHAEKTRIDAQRRQEEAIRNGRLVSLAMFWPA